MPFWKMFQVYPFEMGGYNTLFYNAVRIYSFECWADIYLFYGSEIWIYLWKPDYPSNKENDIQRREMDYAH